MTVVTVVIIVTVVTVVTVVIIVTVVTVVTLKICSQIFVIKKNSCPLNCDNSKTEIVS